MELQIFCDMYLEKKNLNSKNQYICPFCNSGTGKNRTGAFTVYPTNYYCFACGKHGNVNNLVEFMFQVPFSKTKEKLEELLKEVDKSDSKFKYQAKKENKIEIPKEIDIINLKEFFENANKNVYKTDYPSKRGLSDLVVKKFNLGYIENWKISDKAYPSPRLIIPNNEGYLARDIRDEIPEKALGFSKMKVGKTSIFNIQAIKSECNAIIITEGEIDVLSVYEVADSLEAIGLCGVQNRRTLFENLNDYSLLTKDKIFILSLDNDEAGRKGQKDLAYLMEQNGFQYLEINLSGKYKDINEHLVSDREGFIALIKELEFNL